jgi:hypothetical protein
MAASTGRTFTSPMVPPTGRRATKVAGGRITPRPTTPGSERALARSPSSVQVVGSAPGATVMCTSVARTASNSEETWCDRVAEIPAVATSAAVASTVPRLTSRDRKGLIRTEATASRNRSAVRSRFRGRGAGPGPAPASTTAPASAVAPTSTAASASRPAPGSTAASGSAASGRREITATRLPGPCRRPR